MLISKGKEIQYERHFNFHRIQKITKTLAIKMSFLINTSSCWSWWYVELPKKGKPEWSLLWICETIWQQLLVPIRSWVSVAKSWIGLMTFSNFFLLKHIQWFHHICENCLTYLPYLVLFSFSYFNVLVLLGN